MRAGETRTLDLATYLNPGVPDPEPTIISVTPETDLDVQAIKSDASELTLTTGPRVDGTARFRIVMSDVDDPLVRRPAGRRGSSSSRSSTYPTPRPRPCPGRTVRSQEVALSWRAPQDNGAPIEYYEVRDDRGEVTRCGTTTCDIGGLVNGERLPVPGPRGQRGRAVGVERLLGAGHTGREARHRRPDRAGRPGRRHRHAALDAAHDPDLRHRELLGHLPRQRGGPRDQGAADHDHRARQQPVAGVHGRGRERARLRHPAHVRPVPVHRDTRARRARRPSPTSRPATARPR